MKAPMKNAIFKVIFKFPLCLLFIVHRFFTNSVFTNIPHTWAHAKGEFFIDV